MTPALATSAGASVGTVDIEFVAFNPGDWMFHCHKPMHMDGGMATLVKIG
jgi:FtsP/CotA-like multicopper oxidase with cupredoxin domain